MQAHGRQASPRPHHPSPVLMVVLAFTASLFFIFSSSGVVPATAAGTPVPLGTVGSFAAFGGSIANTGATQLTGDVGTSPGAAPIAFPPGHLSGGTHLGDSTAAAALNDLQTAYNTAKYLTPTATIGGDLAGRTLKPGVYYSAAALSLSTTLTLDAGNNPASDFVFQIDAALAFAASARVVLVNEAQADHIFWQVSGAATLGAGATLCGTVLGQAAISAGAGTTVVGRLLSTSGAVSLDSNSILPQAPVALATAANYSALASTAVSNTGKSVFSENVGVSPGTELTGFPPGIATGGLHAGDADANQAQVDLHAAYVDARDRTSTGTLPGSLDRLTLAPGIQNSAGSVILNTTLTLDGQNNPDALFIFQINGSFNSAAGSKILLINGANPDRIFWQVTGNSTLGASSSFSGTNMTDGAITVHAGAALTGRILSVSGSITLDTVSSETLTPLDLVSAINYSVLAATTVENTGSTVVNLNVGVSPGTTIHGFPPGTTTDGSFHPGDSDAAQARSDAYDAYSDATRRKPTQAIAGDLGGLILTSGVFHAGAAISLAGVLTLNAEGDPNAVFIFQLGAAFNTGAGSTIQLENGAQIANLFWQVQGAATLGASSAFSGTLITQGAISAGDQMTLSGRVISLSGSVSLGQVSVTSPSTKPGGLSASSSPPQLSDVTLNGVSDQIATDSSGAWSATDNRGTGAAWSLTIEGTDFVSEPGTVDTSARSIPVGSLTVQPGQITGMSGSDPTSGLAASTVTVSTTPQPLVSSAGPNRGTYLFSPTFSLVVSPTTYRSNYSGQFKNSPINPYVAIITITIS